MGFCFFAEHRRTAKRGFWTLHSPRPTNRTSDARRDRGPKLASNLNARKETKRRPTLFRELCSNNQRMARLPKTRHVVLSFVRPKKRS